MPIVGHEKVCLSRLCVRTDREEALVVSKIYREVGENIQYIGAFNPTVVARYSLGAVGLESRTVDCVRQARTGWAVAGRTDRAGTPAAPQQRQTDPTLCTDPIRG
jgi:hypothetical protein